MADPETDLDPELAMEVAEMLQLMQLFIATLSLPQQLAFITTITRLVFQRMAGPNLNAYRALVTNLTERLQATAGLRVPPKEAG